MDGITSIVVVGLVIWGLVKWVTYVDKKQIEIRNKVLKDFEQQVNLQATVDDLKESVESKNYEEVGKLNKELKCISPHLIGSFNDFLSNCMCPSCGEGHPRERVGKYGEFIGCSNYPNCTYTEKIKSTRSAYETTVKKQILTEIQEVYS